jgi:diguanylate cyclase (GGDEF)-like protein
MQSVHYKSDLGRLTAVIGVALAFFGVVLLAVVAYAGWTANRTAIERERQLVENALDDSVSRVLDEQKSIAWWDDAVIHLAQGRVDTEWADIQIGAFLNETYNHDAIYVLNGANEPVYAYVDGERVRARASYASQRDVLDVIVQEARTGSADLHARARAFEADQSRYSALLGGANASWTGHILSVDGQPAVVSAITIMPNVDPTLLTGEPYLLVSVVRINEQFMSDIGATLLLPDLAISQGALGEGAAAEAFTADDQTSLGYLTWTPRKPGRTLLVFILPLVALGLYGAGLMTWLMIRRLKRASGELALRESRAQHEAKHDQLSSLPNRRHFVEHLQSHLDDLVQSRNNARVIVAYFDVDRFKDINDTLGHQAGDALIVAVGARLQGVLASGDFLARFGGDEFAVMRRAATQADAEDLAGRLRAALAEGFTIHGQNVRMTASIGISMAPDHGVSPDELMRNADIALYQGKNHGRDRAMFFCAEMAAELEQRREIEVDLQAALENDQLSHYYQPLISSKSGEVVGVEALLRWKHPTKGFVPPGSFVPIAEEAGLMPALGAFVIERAFKDAKRWPELEVAINLSPVQFRHVELVSLLEKLIVAHGVDPHQFVLEVTEGVLLESTDRNRKILDEIRGLGFRVALDDFGTGYSSLRYLSDFRFDKIKIDRAFVTGIQERKRALTIIQSVVTLGRGLNMDIVAEGVETEAEASVMRLVGVNELQGFYFSKAVPCEEVQALIDAFSVASAPADAVAAPAERERGRG